MEKFLSLAFLTFCFVLECRSDLACDIYRRRNPNKKNEIVDVYVLHGYIIPRKRYIDILKKNVSCPPCKNEFICLRKCCLQEDSFNSTSKKCKSLSFPAHNKFEPSTILAGDSSSRPPKFANYTVLYGSFCPTKAIEITRFKWTDHGNAYIDHSPLQLDEYCVDYFSDINEFGVMKCATYATKELLSVDFRLTLCFICSELFLLVTFCIYIYVDELRGSLPNKILLCYVINLLITYGVYIILQLYNIYSGTFCIIASSSRIVTDIQMDNNYEPRTNRSISSQRQAESRASTSPQTE